MSSRDEVHAFEGNDDDYVPNRRPQSTIALDFSASLDTIFAIQGKTPPELTGLARSVERKKQAVDSQSKELQKLEARIRETEERLRVKKSSNSEDSSSSSSLPAGSAKNTGIGGGDGGGGGGGRDGAALVKTATSNLRRKNSERFGESVQS